MDSVENEGERGRLQSSPVQESEVLQWTVTGFGFAAQTEGSPDAVPSPAPLARVRADSVVERAVDAQADKVELATLRHAPRSAMGHSD